MDTMKNHHVSQRWSAWIVRRAQAVLVVTLLICSMLVPLAITSTKHTVPDGWLPDSADAVQVQQLGAEQFGRSDTTYYLLFNDPSGNLAANDAAFVQQVQFAVRPFRAMPGVDAVLTWGTTRNDILNNILISEDGRTSLAVITLESPPGTEFGTPDWLRANLAPTELDVSITGLPVVSDDFRQVGHNDLVRAELLSLPITLVLLVVIFRGVIPAILPIVLAAGSMIVTLAAMSVVGRYATVNVFTVNAVTMLGLAVGIDYALIMVSRFREEIAHRPREEALAVTLATAGKTVVTAGSTVAIGLSGLLFFDVPAATTTALLGALVVLAAVVLALGVLPAALAVLADRMARTATPGRPARLLPRVEAVRQQHPGVTLVLCLGILALLTAPVLGIRLVSPGIENLPRSTESRSTAEMIQQQFPLTSISPIEIVVRPQRGSMLESRNLERYHQLTQRIAANPSIQRVESLWTFVPTGFNASTLSTGFRLEPDLVAASQPFLTPVAALITIYPVTSLSDDELHTLVRDLRSDMERDPAAGLQVLVGGRLALDVDVLDHVAHRIPVVVAWVVVFTAAALFLHLRSVVLPFKAILLNLASMGASFGMLAWIFQDGNLAGLINAEATGTTVMLVPVLMFCFLFGLGMDFEVIMLSRIREGWLEHGDTTRAVNAGLERAAGIVTASAMLMLAVFLAFAFSELDVMKALGIGLAIAVVIDATIIRLLLLPATMQLMGRWNWWPSQR